MSLVDSRLGPGTLSLGGTFTDAGCQMSNVKLVPTHTSTEGTPTLCTPKPAPLNETTWALTGSAVQDWEADAGFIEYARLNNNQEVPFKWVPNTGLTPNVVEYSGVVQIRAIEFGGDVSKQNVSTWEFPLVGDPVRAKTSVMIPVGPTKSAAAPGDVFNAEATVTASDATNAAKLSGIGYVASPTTAWTATQKITIGTFDFHWDGSAWAAGAAS